MILDVFGMPIPVKFKQKPCLDDGQPVKGYYDYENREIVLESKLKGMERQQVLIHELSHVVLHRLHLDAETDIAILHPIIDTIATAITENFKLVKR